MHRAQNFLLISKGRVPSTTLGDNQQPLVYPWMSFVIKKVLRAVMRDSVSDAARTQVFLSASSQIQEKAVHGEYWVPTWSWRQRYTGSVNEELSTNLAKDTEEWKRLWNFCQDAISRC
jgi:hypothetical protein